MDGARFALQMTRQEHGPAHENTITRTLDVAVALAGVDQNAEKLRLLEPLLRLRMTVPRKSWNWMLTVARLEFGRACFALEKYTEASRTLRPL